jgi:hypothetical protein
MERSGSPIKGLVFRRKELSGLGQVAAHYKAPFGVEKEDIGLENAYFRDLNPE